MLASNAPYRPPFWWGIMFLHASVCLFVGLSIYLKNRLAYLNFLTEKTLHTSGRTYLILIEIQFKMADLPQQVYKTSFLPYLRTEVRY